MKLSDFLVQIMDSIADFLYKSEVSIFLLFPVAVLLLLSIIKIINDFISNICSVDDITLEAGKQYAHYFGNIYVISHKPVELTKKGYKVYISNKDFEFYPESQYIGTLIIEEGKEVPKTYEKTLSETI